MRLWDFELLMAKTDGGVVQDGLIAWADFQDTITVTESNTMGGTAGTLIDRATGGTLTIRSTDSVNASSKAHFTQADGFICLKNHTSTARNQRLVPSATLPGMRAIEFVFSGNGTNSYPTDDYGFGSDVLYRSGYNDRIDSSLQKTSGGIRLQNSLICAINPVHVFFQVTDGKKGEIYLNGQKMLTGDAKATSFDAGNLFRIGLKGTSNLDSFPPLRVGCVRLYDRVLTQEEIDQNVQYEIKIGRLTI